MPGCGPFMFNSSATTELYTLSLHDALPISESGSDIRRACGKESELLVIRVGHALAKIGFEAFDNRKSVRDVEPRDRKSTRLNSSHGYTSYDVFCLKK